MEAATVQTDKPDKFLVRNNTAGYVGVIEIDHRGDEKGVNIEPFGARWMTEAEMIATARAPRDPADNSFEEQVFMRQNPDTQRQEEFRMRPLTLERDADRFVPSNDRYVPTVDAPEGSAPPVERTAAAAPPPVAGPPSSGSSAATPQAPAPVPDTSQEAPTPALRRERVAGAARVAQEGLAGSRMPAGGDADEAEAQSWVEPPEAPGQVLSRPLAGEDGPAPEEGAEAAPDPTDHPQERFVPVAGQAQAAPQTPGAVEEEHAREVDPEIGEETGRAKPPNQPPPEGEFGRAEEVGSPDAPKQGDDETLVGG